MITLSDHQLEVIMRAAAALSEADCQEFLERVAAAAAVDLQMHGQINDAGVALAVQLALRGLTHNSTVSQNRDRNWLPTRAWRLPAWSGKPRN